MNTHTHTPGPWTATGHDGKMSVIIECKWGSVAKVLPVGAQDQEKANACLIAAAPDLLAVLKSLVFETSHFLHGDGKNGAFVANELRNAFFAIHKAEGVK